ncbi:MAG: 4'-phosphopantetheinyl transferase superfamily protein [Clostridiales bacterium]|nr:4'-phosphopantetheinyl transferase superfamily protein [Clostridiales bacterium]
MTALYGAKGTDGRRLAWPLLDAAVKLCWGWDGLPPVEHSSRGKPLFAGMEDRWFSLSHSGGLALCALSDGPVGVDVELVRPRRSGLPAYVLSGEELARFDGSWGDFYRLWTLKESWCKREDSPLFPPRDVPAPPPCPHRSYAGEGWRAAVCCHDAPPEDIIWL